MLTIIPAIAIVLLNMMVILYVVRERDRARSGFFLLVNAFALIMWSGGYELWRGLSFEPWALALAQLGSVLIPANLLYFAGTRPRPFSRQWESPWMLAAVFLPATILVLRLDVIAATEVRRSNPFHYGTFEQMVRGEGPLILIGALAYCLLTVVLLATRYNVAHQGPDRNLPRHLLLVVLGPLVFATLFALTTGLGAVTLIPSPNLIMALIAQAGILVVIRQEEVERPLYLSRWIYYTLLVVVAFIVSSLLYTTYESMTSQVLMPPAVRVTVLGTIAIVLAAASLPRAQAAFDRLMFRRAYEYRQLVREAQHELHDTRERLRRAERLSVVGEMAARIAHEIKNPLGPIKGYTQMMREKLMQMDEFPQRAQFLRQLSIVSEEVDNIDAKVRSLLDLARKQDMTVRPEDVNRLAERAAILLRLEAESARYENESADAIPRIVEDFDPELPQVMCNRARIEEALANIARNALEAVPPDGVVTIRTRRQPSTSGLPGIALIVEDNGPGFTDEAQRQLFTPFFTEKPGGTGLGLSITRSHMDVHKGELMFEDAEGGGTIATLWLPFEITSVGDQTPYKDGDPRIAFRQKPKGEAKERS